MITGVGLINKDFVASVPAWERDRKAEATAYVEQVGGPVPVALAALARLCVGEEVRFFGVAGDDRDGDDVVRWLGEDGVDASDILRAGGVTTSKSLVVLDARDGSRTLVNHAAHLPPLVFTPAQEAALAAARLLHLDGRDLDASVRAAGIVRGAGGVVSLDLGTMRPGREPLLAQCDIVLASRKGASGAFPSADSPADWVRGFLSMGASVAGVTLGSGGVVIGTPDTEPVHLPAFTVSRIVDTCGAGDVFHGAFLWAHLQGWEAWRCAEWAQAAAALRITRFGNRAGLPTAGAVEAFLAAARRR